MPDIIKLLPDSVANQIAAGEVIQRPASVLKELLENAVDAGSTEIRVIIRDAGRSLVQVIDNGCGMSETDARMAFERHATSKIRDANDLFAIRTMGFRGEALASIAAVAQVELRTRRKEEELGTSVVIHGSALQSQEACQTPAGSNFMVKNLFYNVPARRKFLKTAATELKHIITEFQRVCLVCPETAFTLHHNETEIYNLTGTMPGTALRQRIITLFGKQMNNALIPLDTETSIVRITGYTGKPEFARKTTGEQFFFVNGRYIRHPYLHKAVMQAYEQILPSDSFPSYFVSLQADPAFIDVNIHPTKTEIKFEDEKAVWQMLHATVKEALGKHNLVPSLDFNQENAPEIPVFRPGEPVTAPPLGIDPAYNPFRDRPSRGMQDDRHAVRNWEKMFEGLGREEEHGQGTLGHETAGLQGQKYFQLKGRYILMTVKSGLMMIDQKRAHERVLFEKFMRTLSTGQSASQVNLFPRTMSLNPADYALLLDILQDINRLGFDIRDLGHHSIAINGYPSDTGQQEPGRMIEMLLEEYKNTGLDPSEKAAGRAARAMAVAAAIPYGRELSQEEIAQLVDQLFACGTPTYSPGGKPAVVILRMEELERMF